MHIGPVVRRVFQRVRRNAEDARIARIFDASLDDLCNRCAASFRLDGDDLCAECRHEIDTVYGHLVEGE